MFAVTGAEETLLQSVLETDAALTLSLLAHLGPLIALGCNVHLKEVFKRKRKNNGILFSQGSEVFIFI